VLLLDRFTDQLYIAVLERVSDDDEIAEIWASVPEDLRELALKVGGRALLDIAENSFSNFLQIEWNRQHISTDDPVRAVQLLFEQHVLHDGRLAPSA
jgi:hypothetical protein